jgi:type I restriction enzyme S subunit
MYWLIANSTFLKETALYTTLPIINNQTLGNYPMLAPFDDIEEREIADFLDERCTKIDICIEKKKKLVAELESYKRSLIYEYVTGKKEA